jgi:hypothetical protein
MRRLEEPSHREAGDGAETECSPTSYVGRFFFLFPN